LRLCAAGARVQTHNGVSPIVGPTQNLGELGLGHRCGYLGDFRRGFVEGLLALFFLRELEKETRLFESCSVFFPGVDDLFQRGLLFENSLRLFAVVPEIRT